MNQRILLLGATGTVGRFLLGQFPCKGFDVTVGLHTSTASNEAVNHLPCVEVDYDVPSSLLAALKGVECVFIIVPDSAQMVGHMKNICNAIEDQNVKRFVYVGGLGARVAPETWLSQQLLSCEALLKRTKTPGIILRPCFFMQNFLLHYPPKKDGCISMPMGKGLISYIDAEDIATAAFHCLTKSQYSESIATYHLTGKKAYNNYHLADIMTEILQKDFYYLKTTIAEERKKMSASNLPLWFIDMISGIYKCVQQNAYSILTSDFEEITQTQPRDFATFIENNQKFFENALR